MHRMRGGIIVFSITLGFMLLSLAGCQKKQTYLNVVEQTPYLGFPQGPGHIWQVDLSSLRSREDFNSLRTEWEKLPGLGQFIKGLREQTGFDAWTRLDTLCVAQSGPGDALNELKNKLVIARGQLDDVSGALDKLNTYLGNEYLISPPPFAAGQTAGFTTYKSTAQSQYNEKVVYDINLGFPSPRLITLAFSGEQNSAMLEIISGQQPGLQKERAWLDRLRQVNTGATFWATGLLVDAAPSVKGLVGPAQEYFVNVSGLQEVRVQIGLVCPSIDEATKLTENLKARLAALNTVLGQSGNATLAGIPQKIFILTDLQTSKINCNLTAAEWRTLNTQFSQLSGVTRILTQP